MEQAHKNLLLANQFRVNHQPERALEFLKQVDEATLDTARFWFIRGQSLFQLKRYQEALRDAEKGLSLSPHDLDLLWLRGKCKMVNALWQEAEQVMLSALSQSPSNVVLLCEMAVIRAKQRRIKEATEYADKAASLFPEHASVKWARMHIADNRQNHKELEQHSREALSADPDYAFGHYMLGHALLRQNKVKDAHHAFHTAARLAPADPDYTKAARQSSSRMRWFIRPFYSRHYYAFLLIASLIATIIILIPGSTSSDTPGLASAPFIFLLSLICFNMFFVALFLTSALLFVILRAFYDGLQSLVDRLQ